MLIIMMTSIHWLMTQLILNLQNDMEASGETMTSSLLEASLNYASPIQPQENDLAKKMRDISGQRCLEQFGKLSRHGLWARTFSDLLIGMEGWYSKRCRLTWKLKGTKFNRMYFQLYPSTLPTEGTEFGLLQGEYKGLYPTVAAQDATGIKNLRKDASVSEVGFHSMSLTHFATIGLLPTPQAMDCMTNPPRQITESGRIISNQGHNGSAPLKDLAMNGLLPTPKVGGQEGYETRAKRQGHKKAISHLEAFVEFHTQILPTPMASDCGDKVTGLENQDSLTERARLVTGTTSQLSPLFTLEMMGFATDWTLLPFLLQNGETNPSKPQEMP